MIKRFLLMLLIVGGFDLRAFDQGAINAMRLHKKIPIYVFSDGELH